MQSDKDQPPKSLPARTQEALEAMERERQKLRELALAHARLRAKLFKKP